jgi:oxygen-dependent protoporphyrinogen oxidase
MSGNSVAIIGGGITGLTAGFCLQRRGVPVTVYEASHRVGGVIESVRQGGYLAEFGPNTILETSPRIGQLVRDAGLAGRRLDPSPQAEARYVVRYGRPVAMPGSPLGFFTSRLFTARAKLALLCEPFVPPRRDGKEESVAEFVIRRLGREFLDQAIDALVAGVYAGDPCKLSVLQAFPKLGQLEARYGSLIKGQIFGARERKRRGEVAKDRAPKFSFDEGLQVLPDTLRERLGEAVRLGASVTRLIQAGAPPPGASKTGAPPSGGSSLNVPLGAGVPQPTERPAPLGWTVQARQDGRELRAEHSAVIYAGTAYALAEMPIEAQPPLSFAPFAEIRYPPVASVVLGFRREDVAHPCQGYGMLIPKIEGFKILGAIFSSSLFPNRAPPGHLMLTSYVGGERYPELASRPPSELAALTCEDLRVLLGVKGKPTFQHIVFYPRAIPQYNLGYGRYRELMSQIERQAPGLFLAGHYRDGISLSDSIVSGCNVAERVEKHLSQLT